MSNETTHQHACKRDLLRKWAPIVVRVSGFALPAVILIFFSRIPWAFTYLEVGKLIGPIPGLDILFFALFVIIIPVVSSLASMRLKKNRTVWFFALNIILLSFIISSFSIVFMPQVSLAGKKIDTFVTENANSSFQEYASNVSLFLHNNVGSAWDKPEAIFRIDNLISYTLLDPHIMKVWGVTRADLIVYQGWGTCGQAALLIGELFQRAGYETRQAFFKGIDHQWAEVKHNGTWWIVDPWYIGNLVQPKNLRDLKPAFQKASGVKVRYTNGTSADASLEHGY